MFRPYPRASMGEENHMRSSPIYNAGAGIIVFGSTLTAIFLLLATRLGLPNLSYIGIGLMVIGVILSVLLSLKDKHNPILPLIIALALSAGFFFILYFLIGPRLPVLSVTG